MTLAAEWWHFQRGGSMRRGARVVGAAIVVMVVVATASVAARVAAGQTAEKRAITFKDLISLHRVGEPQISPDGNWIAYSVATPDLEANRSVRDIWVVAAGGGGEARQLTRGGSDTRARWSPDGKTLAFISSVYPDCRDDACNAARDAAKEKNKVKARIYEKLLYRHWNEWWDGKRSHLFVAAMVGGGAARDLTPGANYDVPPFSEGAPEAIAFSPDGRELCFTANTDKDEALSTNGDLFTVEVSGGSEPKRITTNPGNDWGPAYSRDGKWIAYRAQFLAGYEADRWRLMLFNRATSATATVTEEFDHSVESYEWSPDSQTIYFTAEENGEMILWGVALPPRNEVKGVLAGFNSEFDLSSDGNTLAIVRTSLTLPAEVFAMDFKKSSTPRQLTHHNDMLLSQLELAPPEAFWFEGADKAKVEGFIIRPPHFDAARKYPALFLIHGGPQGAWTDAWGYRWNQQ